MSKRYIDADKLLTTLPDDLPYKASVKRVLMQAPSEDVVEVVRCKDCRYKDECNQYVVMCGDEKELAFCSYGERREE